MTAQGLLGETASRVSARGLATNYTNQRVYYILAELTAGDSIASLSVVVSTGGTGTTLVKLGIYDTAGNLLRATGDNHASFNGATGLITTNLTSAYVVPTSGAYYLAFLSVGGTPPVLLSPSSTVADAGWTKLLGSGVAPCAFQSSQTDLPNPASFTSNSTGALPIWIGAS
jgi:hypothetical protein